MVEIMATYQLDIEGLETEIITVQKYPNGKFYNHYGNYKGHSVAGYFESLEEAEKMVLKHRPSARKI